MKIDYFHFVCVRLSVYFVRERFSLLVCPLILVDLGVIFCFVIALGNSFAFIIKYRIFFFFLYLWGLVTLRNPQGNGVRRLYCRNDCQFSHDFYFIYGICARAYPILEHE